MGSRFFHAADSSSESDSSEEEELYSGDEEEEKQEEDSDEEGSDDESSLSSDEEGGKTGVSKFLRDAASSEGESSDDETPKIVKSAKGKRLEEVEGVIKLIENAQKINDWSSISTGECTNQSHSSW